MIFAVSHILIGTNELFGASPSFSRQEIRDDGNNWFLSPTQNDDELFQTVEKENVTNCEINDINYTFPDISSVSYYSNGNTLNSTIWLSSPQVVPTNENVSFMYIVFTIHFDVHSTFDERLDYVAGILWNNTSQEWRKEVAENSFDGKTRLLTATANYSGSDGLNPSGGLHRFGNYSFSFPI